MGTPRQHSRAVTIYHWTESRAIGSFMNDGDKPLRQSTCKVKHAKRECLIKIHLIHPVESFSSPKYILLEWMAQGLLLDSGGSSKGIA